MFLGAKPELIESGILVHGPKDSEKADCCLYLENVPVIDDAINDIVFRGTGGRLHKRQYTIVYEEYDNEYGLYKPKKVLWYKFFLQRKGPAPDWR